MYEKAILVLSTGAGKWNLEVILWSWNSFGEFETLSTDNLHISSW